MRPALGNALPDAAHADDAQRAAVDVAARKHVVAPGGPLAGAQEMFALGQAAGRGHEQRKAEVGRGFGQHVGGVGALHASGGHGIYIKVVVAHSHVGHDFQARRGSDEGGVDALAAGGEGAVLVGQPRGQLVGRPDHIIGVGFDLEMLRQALHHLRKNRAGNQDAGLAHFSSPMCCASITADETGAIQAGAAEQGLPCSEGGVPLPAARSDAREGGSGKVAQGDVLHLNQMKVMTMNKGTRMPPDHSM